MFALLTLLGFIRPFNSTHLGSVNLYQLTGLQPTSSERDIKRAFKRYLSQKRRNPSPSARAAESHRLVEFAFDVIGCPASRALYNEFSADFLNLTAFHVYGYQSDAALHVIRQMLGSVPREMLEFGGLLFFPVEFDLVDFLNGGERVVSVVRTADCVCPNGEARGCVKCRKEPHQEQIVRERIALPRGAPEFFRVMAGGLGDTKRARGAGDVVFTAVSRDTPRFRRDGADIHTDVRISLADAVRGAAVELENFDGARVAVDVAGGIQHGEERRIMNAGLPYFLDDTQRGDLVVRFLIEFPEKLSDEQRAAIAEELPDDDSFYE